MALLNYLSFGHQVDLLISLYFGHEVMLLNYLSFGHQVELLMQNLAENAARLENKLTTEILQRIKVSDCYSIF